MFNAKEGTTMLSHAGHPYLVGDRVVLRCKGNRPVYCTIACRIPLLVRHRNGKTEQVSAGLLSWNYGRR